MLFFPGLYLKPDSAGVRHTQVLGPENMIQQVWSGALEFILRDTGLHGTTFPFLEIVYPQGVTAK